MVYRNMGLAFNIQCSTDVRDSFILNLFSFTYGKVFFNYSEKRVLKYYIENILLYIYSSLTFSTYNKTQISDQSHLQSESSTSNFSSGASTARQKIPMQTASGRPAHVDSTRSLMPSRHFPTFCRHFPGSGGCKCKLQNVNSPPLAM